MDDGCHGFRDKQLAAKKFFGNFLPTHQNIVSKMRYERKLKKMFNPKFCDEILILPIF